MGASQKPSYLQGLYEGLEEQLKKSRKKVESEMGLVLVKDEGLEAFTKQKYPKLKSSVSHQVKSNALGAYLQGKEDGTSIKLRQGLSDAEPQKLSS